MRRATMNFLIDMTAWVVMLLLIATGLIIRYALPPGSGGRGGGPQAVLWGLGRHDWGDVHFWLSVVLGVLLVLHLALHWTWVWATTRRYVFRTCGNSTQPSKAVQNMYGLAILFLAVFLTLAFVWFIQANVTIQNGRRGYHGGRSTVAADRHRVGATAADASAASSGRQRRTGVPRQETAAAPGMANESGRVFLRGSMTLGEAADALGITDAELKRELHLAEDLPPAEKLGRTARGLGCSMSELRRRLVKFLEADRLEQ